MSNDEIILYIIVVVSIILTIFAFIKWLNE